MEAVDIIVLVIVCAAFVAAVGVIIYRKVTKKGGCDCGCDCCPHGGKCGTKKK